MNNDSLIQDSVLEGIDTAVAVFDNEMRLEIANTAFCRLWCIDIVWLKLRPSLSEFFEKLRTDRRLPEVPDFALFKKQEIEKFKSLSDAHTDMMFLPDGRTLRRQITPNRKGGLIYSFQDISEYLKLQRSVKEMGAVQRETLDHLYEGIAVFGSDGKLKLHNPIFLRFWDLGDKIVTSDLHLSDVIEMTRPLIFSSKKNEEWSDPDWTIYKNRVVAKILGRTQSTGRLRLKNEKVIDYINVPLPDGAVLLSYTDVTDNDKMEQALSERAQALEDANQIKSEFIANVSKEIRSPLSTVAGHAEMLENEYFGELNLRQKEYVRGIVFTSKGLIRVVGDILELAMMDSGQMKLSLQLLDIHELLVSSLHLVQNRAHQKQIKIDFDCPKDIGCIMGDYDRLRQVFYKLLSNAINFTRPRGELVLGASREKTTIIISLADTGIGISGKEREKIFEPFYKVALKKTDQKSNDETNIPEEYGVGLGLTIVKRFVERHNGNLEIKSLVGRGTRVICRFPIVEEKLGAAS